MAKTMLLREIPDDINQILEDYKANHRTNENTKAALGMIREYPYLVKTMHNQRVRILQLEEQLSNMTHHLKQWLHHEGHARKLMQQLGDNNRRAISPWMGADQEEE